MSPSNSGWFRTHRMPTSGLNSVMPFALAGLSNSGCACNLYELSPKTSHFVRTHVHTPSILIAILKFDISQGTLLILLFPDLHIEVKFPLPVYTSFLYFLRVTRLVQGWVRLRSEIPPTQSMLLSHMGTRDYQILRNKIWLPGISGIPAYLHTLLQWFPKMTLQSCLQKGLVTSRTKIFSLPPDPVEFMTILYTWI